MGKRTKKELSLRERCLRRGVQSVEPSAVQTERKPLYPLLKSIKSDKMVRSILWVPLYQSTRN